MSDDQLVEWLTRIEAEYREMPGLHLTARQMQRLWGLDEDTCTWLLEALVVSGFLVREDDEQYARAFDGEPPNTWIAGDRIRRPPPG